jgi:spore maturation protein CgeB
VKILALTYERDWELPEHEVMYADAKEGISLNAIKAFDPDIILEREFNDGIAHYEALLKHFPDVPKAWWWIDSHLQYEAKKDYARNFDYVFLAVSRNVEPLRSYLRNGWVFWLPLCWPYPSDKIIPNTQPKRYDISFVGRWNPQWFPERTRYIELLKQHYGDRFHAVTDYDNMLSIVRQSKVSLNCAIRNDLNFRVFEVLGCGTELITDPVSDLFSVEGLENWANIYRSPGDLIRTIDRLLAGEIRHDMGAIQEEIKAKHTLKQRLHYILNTIHAHS